eukprot:746049-Hanusia_phi.AAC.2
MSDGEERSCLPAPLTRARRVCRAEAECDSKGRGHTGGLNEEAGTVYDGPSGSPEVVLFTKADCTLCDKVKAVLKECKDSHPHSLSQVCTIGEAAEGGVMERFVHGNTRR